MGLIKDFFQSLKSREKMIQYINPRTESGNIDLSHSVYAKQVTQVFLNKDSPEVKNYETIIRDEIQIELKEAIIPIELLISEGKFIVAIQKFEDLINSDRFNSYTSNEKFLIYNGILNCHINNDSDDDIIKYWIVKIEALGTEITEIHRFYFLLAIWKYNNNEFDKALILIAQAIKAKPDYINAISTEILLKCNRNLITYADAKDRFEELLKIHSLDIKDSAIIYSSYGNVAFDNKDYFIAEEKYIKSNQLSKSLSKEIAIAVCEYFEAFKDIKDNSEVDFESIDFKILQRSEQKFDTIYKNSTPDTIQSIVRMSFTFLFNILAITNNFEKILLLYGETKEYFNNKMLEAIKYVTEAEIVTGVLNIDTIKKFDEYEQIKYEVLYLERIKKYKEEIELLLPALEGKYQKDKLLQFSLLNALKETNQFERYMEYYKRFSGHQDDVMRMNYIQFLKQLGKHDLVIIENEKLKTVVKNSFVLYDMLLLYLEYKLDNELDEFFKKVDSGEYKIIGLHMPFVYYNKMMYLLNKKRYEEYFELYETKDLSFLSDKQRLLLKINYYIIKGNDDEVATSYYDLFKATGDYNELLKAVQIKIDINKYHEAEFFFQYINPTKLEKPEFYYMLKAIILKENGKIEEAFKILDDTKEMVAGNLDSPFHQFYTVFNMNNGRTDDAVRYMSDYYTKNPNPNWFKVIQRCENDTGEELLKKLEEVAGSKRDLSQVNNFFSKGILGLSSYSHITGIPIDDILLSKQYPFSKIYISTENVYKSTIDVDMINNKILIDATTLTLLSKVNGLNLLDEFDEILIPYSTVKLLKQRESGITGKELKYVLDYIKSSPYIKNVPVEEGLKIKGYATRLIPEDILDCIALSENLAIPFLNSEVAVNIEFKSKYVIDMNTFFFYLKKNKQSLREIVADTIFKMRKSRLEFLSFDSDDMYIMYSKEGLKGIKPFIKMGINADYTTFNSVYIRFLSRVKIENNSEEFKLCAKEIILYIDKYVGKTRYYMYSIIQNHPVVKEDFERLIKKPSVKDILLKNTSYNINSRTAYDYMEIIESYDFKKILGISTAFVGFVIQFIALFKDNESERTKYIEFIKENININDEKDVDYILRYITRLLEERKGK